MAVTGLTPVQQRAVDALAANGRLARVPVDLTKATIFMRQAQDVITDLPHLTKAQNRYNLAYDALFLCAVIDKPPDEDARRFDQLRRSRNRQRYDARPVS